MRAENKELKDKEELQEQDSSFSTMFEDQSQRLKDLEEENKALKAQNERLQQKVEELEQSIDLDYKSDLTLNLDALEDKILNQPQNEGEKNAQIHKSTRSRVQQPIARRLQEQRLYEVPAQYDLHN